MNLEQFKEKFDFFEKFKNKMPGIEVGFQLLKEFSDTKKSIKFDQNSDVVTHYDYISNSLDKYSFVDLNARINLLYTNNVINNNLLYNNKLYWIISNVYEKFYKIHNYKYNKNSCDMHDVLAHFFYSLRKNLTSDITKFFVQPVLNGYKDIQFFDPEITADKYYKFLFNFLLELYEARVLDYSSKEHAIVFNPEYKSDLTKLIFFSFDLMLLGKSSITNQFMNLIDLSNDDFQNDVNTLYQQYEKGNESIKLQINDILVSLILSSSVSVISAHSKINNLFIEIKNR